MVVNCITAYYTLQFNVTCNVRGATRYSSYFTPIFHYLLLNVIDNSFQRLRTILYFFFSSFHTVVLLSLISIMTVKHNYLFINPLFLLITGCLYDYMFRSSYDHPQIYKSYYLHVLIVHRYFSLKHNGIPFCFYIVCIWLLYPVIVKMYCNM